MGASLELTKPGSWVLGVWSVARSVGGAGGVVRFVLSWAMEFKHRPIDHRFVLGQGRQGYGKGWDCKTSKRFQLLSRAIAACLMAQAMGKGPQAMRTLGIVSTSANCSYGSYRLKARHYPAMASVFVYIWERTGSTAA